MRKRKKRSLKKLVCFFLPFFLLFFALMGESALQRQLLAYAEPEIYTLAYDALNDAAETALRQTDGTFITLTETQNGFAIETDTEKINAFTIEVTNAAAQSLHALKESTLSVPLGSLLPGSLFFGRGPALDLKVVPYGVLDAKLVSSFDSCGINQVRHRLTLTLTATVSALTSFRAAYAEVSCDYVLAETIFSGEIPDQYLSIVGETRQAISKKIE